MIAWPFVHPSAWYLQNTKELTSHGVLGELGGSPIGIQPYNVLYGILPSSPEGKRVSHSPRFNTPCPIPCEVTPTFG